MDIEKMETILRSIHAIKPKKESLKTQFPDKWKNHLLYLAKKHKDKPIIQQAYRNKIVIGQDLLNQFFTAYPDLDIPVSFDRWGIL